MKILYISGLCSKKVYQSVVASEKDRTGQQAQKFGHLLVDGLKKNGADVYVICRLPVNRRNSNRLIVHKKSEIEKGIAYHYNISINIPLIRNISTFFETLILVTIFCMKNRNCAIICDPMIVMAFFSARIVSKLFRNVLVAVLSDIPTIYAGNVNGKISKAMGISSWLMKKADCYILFTLKMNRLANPKSRPYIVIEGMVDGGMINVANTLGQKYEKRVCLYSGGIIEIYGLGMLVQAFCIADIPNCELHIYGGGSYADKLSQLCKNHKNVRYFGVKDNAFVIKEQIKATLLINPRLTNFGYTEYSFPSKNMEYLASGTPVLTTNLPGMPEEYKKYVYLFNDETVEGMAQTLIKVMSKSELELYGFGKNAKQWVIEYKNNLVQSKAILDLITYTQNITKQGEGNEALS